MSYFLFKSQCSIVSRSTSLGLGPRCIVRILFDISLTLAMAAYYRCSTCFNSWESYRVDGWVTCRECETEVWPYNRSNPEESDDSSDVSEPSQYECHRCGNTWESRYADGWVTCRGCDKEVWPHNKSSPVVSEDSDDEAACYRCPRCYNKWKSYRVDGWVTCRDCRHDVMPYKRP